MPLLPMEPCVSPETLFSDPEFSGDRDGCWWVLHTRPRAEKALARRLSARNLSFFLPLYKRQWRSRGRSFRAHLPLFPGYLFLHGDSQVRVHALETNLVARVLTVVDQAQLQGDLARVHQLMVAGVTIAPEERLQPGMFVEIISGPLMGLEGKILGSYKKTRFFIEVQFLQQGVSVEIESWMIRPLSKGALIPAGAVG